MSDSAPLPLVPPVSLRVKEAARALGVGHSTLYNLMAAGRLAYRELGGIRLIDPEALVAFRNSLPVIGPDMTPTGPLLPVDQQRLAVERASDPPKRRPRKSKAKARARPRPRGPAPAPESLAPVDQQPPVVEPPPADEPSLDQQRDLAAIYFERLKLLAPNGEQEGRFRAFEFAVRRHCAQTGCGLDDAKQLVLAAISKAKEKV